MEDIIEKLEKNRFINEGIWEKITNSVSSKKSSQYGIFTYTENIGWHIGPNRIKTFRNDHSLSFESEKFDWLTKPEVKFFADVLYVSNGKIGFSGIWSSGEFKGDLFFSMQKSYFRGGIFNGGKFEAIWDAHPTAFENGTVGIQEDLLGVKKAKTSTRLINFNLLSVKPKNYIEVLYNSNKSQVFQLVKTIDNINSEFIFKTIPEEKIVKFLWTDLKQDYENTVEVSSGGSFIIPGVITVNNVESIIIHENYEYQAKYKIPLNLGKIQQMSMPYDVVYLTIDANKNRKEEAENLNKKIIDGTFGANLEYLKKDIQSSVDSGDASDLSDYFLKLKSGKLNGITEELVDVSSKLSILANLLKQYVDPNIKDSISKYIQSYLKPKISANPSTIEKSVIEPTNSSNQIKNLKNAIKGLKK